jgi:hypothetical protein|tara:strand:- start:111 stop:737 length:627 start_codon:yes stop_codon:yes gene_type:complete
MLSVFSSLYAGNLLYYSTILRSEFIKIDLFENFHKQSYRNRCSIASPNGNLNLIIPINRKSKSTTREVKIDNSQNWRKVHWKSLESAYRSSPYFEFYEDKFRSIFFMPKCNYLFEFNHLIFLEILKLLNVEKEVSFTDFYIPNGDKIYDFRNLTHPKNPLDNQLKELKYHQVFQEKQNFIPNLSVLDLLFNEGPMAKQILMKLNNYKN